MSNEWNIGYIRKIAGLNPIMESVDDDDEDPDVKIAMKDKRQAAFEKRNKNELSSAEKEAAIKEKMDKEKAKEAREKKANEKPVAKKEAPKAEPKAEEKPAAKAEEKPAESNESNEAKRRGRAPSDSAKAGQARAWLAAHPGAKRGEFIAHASEWGMTKHYANQRFYAIKHALGSKTEVKEVYFLSHPSMPSFLLAENREINQMQWVDPTSPLVPMMFESKAEAEKIAKYMSEWKSQYANIDTVTLTD